MWMGGQSGVDGKRVAGESRVCVDWLLSDLSKLLTHMSP